LGEAGKERSVNVSASIDAARVTKKITNCCRFENN
jgi:hypothetical protein